MPNAARSPDEILARLKELVAGLDIRPDIDQIGATTCLFKGGLGLDSFAVLELIVGVERVFGIEFLECDLSPESFRDLRTLGEVVARTLLAQA